MDLATRSTFYNKYQYLEDELFRGVNALNLDAKGRMAMPTRYRQRLADSCHGQMVITVDNSDRCLLVYPLNEWEVVERRIQKLPVLISIPDDCSDCLLGTPLMWKWIARVACWYRHRYENLPGLKKKPCWLGKPIVLSCGVKSFGIRNVMSGWMRVVI